MLNNKKNKKTTKSDVSLKKSIFFIIYICSGINTLVIHLWHGFVVVYSLLWLTCIMVCGGIFTLMTHLYHGLRWWYIHSSSLPVAGLCSGIFTLVTHLYHGLWWHIHFKQLTCIMVCGGGVFTLVTYLWQGFVVVYSLLWLTSIMVCGGIFTLTPHLYRGLWWHIHFNNSPESWFVVGLSLW